MTDPSSQTECGGVLVLGVATHESGGLDLRIPSENLDSFAYLLKVFCEFYVDQAIRAGFSHMADQMREALQRTGWLLPGFVLARPRDDGKRAVIQPVRMRGGAVAWGVVKYPEGHILRARIVPPDPSTMGPADVAELLDLWGGQWCGYRRSVTLEIESRASVIQRFNTIEGAREAITTRVELS